MTPISRDTGPQSWPKMVKKIETYQMFKIRSMISDEAISAVGTDIRPLVREIQALKIGQKWSKNRKKYLFYGIWESHIHHRNPDMIPISRDTGPQSWLKIVKKSTFICPMTSDKAISAIRADIWPLSREIQLKVGRQCKKNRKISNCSNLLYDIW